MNEIFDLRNIFQIIIEFKFLKEMLFADDNVQTLFELATFHSTFDELFKNSDILR